MLEDLRALYSRAAHELVGASHFAILQDLELCEFIDAVSEDAIKNEVEEFLVRSASDTTGDSGRHSSEKNIQVLGGVIPEVVHAHHCV